MGDLTYMLISLALAAPAPPPTTAEVRRLADLASPATELPSARGHQAADLMRQAEATPYSPPARYVLLAAARDDAAGQGDATGAVTAARALAAAFGLNELTLTCDALVATAPHAATGSQFAALARLGVDAVNRRLQAARTADDYASISTLATATATWALAGNDAALQVTAQAWAQDVRAACAEAARIGPALERLQVAPDDPDANLAVGRLLCCYQADWSRGLPHLIKGADTSLSVLAEMELSHGSEPTAWAQLGDGWWEQGRTLNGVARRNVWRHACAWYGKAYPRAIGPRRALIERRAAEAGVSPSDWQLPPESP